MTEVSSELLVVPRLGTVRAQSLADAGFNSLAALSAASEEQLAAVKWVGAGNARRIKEWLAAQSGSESAAPTPPQDTPISKRKRKSSEPAAKPTVASVPQRRGKRVAAVVAVSAPSLPGPVIDELATAMDDPGRSSIDTSITRLQETLPKKSRAKKLDRQLHKVVTTVAEVPVNLDALAKNKEAAVKALDQIAKLLSDAVESGKLSAKKQEAMGAELKKFRKRLDKALGG